MKKKVEEANKSGDSSLRDWFGKSKSSDGKLVGCNLVANMQENPAPNNQDKQLNPSAVLQKMKRNLNKDEEEAAFRRKQKQDPNPNRKGKAINVKTEDLDLKKISKEYQNA